MNRLLIRTMLESSERDIVEKVLLRYRGRIHRENYQNKMGYSCFTGELVFLVGIIRVVLFVYNSIDGDYDRFGTITKNKYDELFKATVDELIKLENTQR